MRSEEELIPFANKLIKDWANRLYYIAKEGLHYSKDNLTRRRYGTISAASYVLYEKWKKTKGSEFCEFDVETMNNYLSYLEEIIESGTEFTKDKFEKRRYKNVEKVWREVKRAFDLNLKASKDFELTSESESVSEEIITQFLTDKELAKAIYELISETKEEVLICSPWIDDKTKFLEKLISLKQEKMVVILITRKKDKTKKGELKKTSHNKGLDKIIKNKIIFEANPTIHTKMIIVDKQKVYIGSANMVSRSFNTNQEAGIITNNEEVVSKAIGYFDKLYEDAIKAKVEK